VHAACDGETSQALQWEEAHTSDAAVECMVVRSKHMLNPDTKLETLSRLAAFVGSICVEELCHMSQLDAVYLGQSKSRGLYNDKWHTTLRPLQLQRENKDEIGNLTNMISEMMADADQART
jgi:hypothetical protein